MNGAAPASACARRWKPAGAFRLGAWGWPVSAAALIYGLAAIINIAWPRMPGAAWYANYAVLLSTAAVVAGGLLYMAVARRLFAPGRRDGAPSRG